MGESHVGHSCGTRPRSAVTVSFHLPALARLTRSVRAMGRVDPSLSDGSQGLEMYRFCKVPCISWALRRVYSMSDIPAAPGTSSSRIYLTRRRSGSLCSWENTAAHTQPTSSHPFEEGPLWR